MKYLHRLLVAATVVLVCASPAGAGQVRLEIRDGLVTLDARDASVREILAEWARVGQTRIVNGERVPGGALTLQLEGVPEKKALDLLLRASAGYIAAPRRAAAEAGSQYDRIVVMAMARPPAGGLAPASPAQNSPMDRRPMDRQGLFPTQPGVMLDDQDEPVVQPNPAAAPGYPATQGSPNSPGGSAPYQPGGMPVYQPGVATPVQPGAPTQGGQPGVMPPAQPGSMPTTQTARPGMPTQPIKPPGGPGGE